MQNKKIKCFDDYRDSNFLLDDLVIRFRIPQEIQKELPFNETLDSLGFASEDFDNWDDFNAHFDDTGLYLIVSSNDDEMHFAVVDSIDFVDLMSDLCNTYNAKVILNPHKNDVTNTSFYSMVNTPTIELFKK